MSEVNEGPEARLGPRGLTHSAGYRPLIGAHRAAATGHPQRGYLLTVALLAGTASMPILTAFSAGSATVGRTALPDAGMPFIPTPSVGPVVVPLPTASRPAVRSTAAGRLPPSPPPLPAAPLPPAGANPGSAHRPDPAGTSERVETGDQIPRPSRPTSAPTGVLPSPVPSSPGSTPTSPTPTSPTPSPRPSPVPLPSPPSTSEPPTPRPRPAAPGRPPAAPAAPAAPGRPPAAIPSVRPDPSLPRPVPSSAEGGAAVLLPAPLAATGPLAEVYGVLPAWITTSDATLLIHFG